MDKEKPKKISLSFHRHKLSDDKKNSIKELISLYKEDETKLDSKENGDSEMISKEISLKNIIEKKRQRRRRRMVISLFLILFVFASAAFAGFLYFSQNSHFAKDKLQLKITGPEKTMVGAELTYTVKYQNIGNIALTNSRVLIQYPHGFSLSKAEPEGTNHTWGLGTLSVNQAGEIKLTGKIIDELDRPQTMTATFVFEPSNFSSNFSKEASYGTILESPDLTINTDSTPTISLGQKLILKTTIKNRSQLDFKSLKLEFIYPDKFSFATSTPKADEDSNVFFVKNLLQDTVSNEIYIEGNFPTDLTFANDAERTKEFTVNLYVGDDSNGFHLLKQNKFTTQISAEAVSTNLIINGSTDNKNIELGSVLTYSLVAKNNGDKSYQDVTLKALINSAPIDILNWDKISDEHYGRLQKTDAGKEIVWTKTQFPALGELKGGDEVTLTFSIPVKTIEQLKNENLASLGETAISNLSSVIFATGDAGTAPPINGSEIKLTLNSNVNFGAKALYYYDDGTPIGEGPFPPRVDQKTKLQVFFDLSNDIHELSDISIKSTLPGNIKLTGEKNVTVGEFKYDDTKRELSWTISTLPTTLRTAHCSFGIEFMPAKADIGNLIQILGNSTLTAKDTFTGATIVRTENSLTSALDQDKYATGTGTVQK